MSLLDAFVVHRGFFKQKEKANQLYYKEKFLMI